MRRWQAETIYWGLFAGLFVAAFVATAVPRWNNWCLLFGGTSAVLAPVFMIVVSWKGWVEVDDKSEK